MDEEVRRHSTGHDERSGDDLPGSTDSSGAPSAAAFQQRIDCLKLLALTLVREIESLENARTDIPEFDLTKETRRFECELIRSALIKTGGRQRRAARLLGMKVTTLNTKIRRYGIDDETIV